MRRDQSEYWKVKAIVQAVVNHEAAQEALDSFREVQIPYYEGQQKKQRAEHIKKLMEEINRGPLQITRVYGKPGVKSSLRTRVVKRERVQNERLSRLSKKMGGVGSWM